MVMTFLHHLLMKGRAASTVLAGLAEGSCPLCLEGRAAPSGLVSLVQGSQPLGLEGRSESRVLF